MNLEEVSINMDKGHADSHPLLDKHGSNTQENYINCTYNASNTVHSTKLHVTVQGDRARSHSIVTFHDVGLNSVSNFAALMNSEPMAPVIQKYCIYHIDAPGQEENASALPAGYVYPSMENLSDMLPTVFSHFGLKSAICVGCGAGANVFIRFAMKNPNMVEGLIVTNPSISTVGNLSWIGEKISNITTPFTDQVMNYHFTKSEVELVNHELLDNHRKHFKQFMNADNVSLFMKEYDRRAEVSLVRSPDPQLIDKTTLSCQTIILVGDLSPFVDDAVELNSRLNPKKTTFLKMADAGGMILEEQIFKVAESITYFLQGLGHTVRFPMRGTVPGVMMTRLARSRTISSSSGDGDHKRIRTLSSDSTGASPTHQPINGEKPLAQTDKTHLVSEAVC
uniref:Protein NDRG2 n=1 Tax=Phallusia mammillata TaxID=59560 RepID=A0A6F9DMP4_9ASCI|nr:protein NDRG2 [Phallusia mammillata]